ncbi:hypothetical protein [Devosia sp.]|uniref:hypothetical protein n=1 Tax=Devosia sp. TaxID=1871048 RepID=UPI002733603C|nr:hypothetical protein [Devosia sp.]MDP2782139.1 hypothetical protein [Devosia sp.]
MSIPNYDPSNFRTLLRAAADIAITPSDIWPKSVPMRVISRSIPTIRTALPGQPQ